MEKREWTRTRSVNRDDRNSTEQQQRTASAFITLGRERVDRTLPTTNSSCSLAIRSPSSSPNVIMTVATHTTSPTTTSNTTTTITTTTTTTTTATTSHNLTPSIQLDSIAVPSGITSSNSPRSSPRLGNSPGSVSPAWNTLNRANSPNHAGSSILSEEIAFENFPIHDEDGKDFWVCFFGTKKAVLWETFYKGFISYVEQDEQQKTLRARELDFDLNLKRRCLLALLSNLQSDGELEHYHQVSPNNENQAVVTMEVFGQMLHWFGSVGARWDFMGKLSYLLSKSWFFGKLSSRASETMLKNEEPGTFIIRFSTSEPGSYTISVKQPQPTKSGSYIFHYRVIKRGVDKYEIGNVVAKSIDEARHKFKKELNLRKPCPSSCFVFLFALPESTGEEQRYTTWEEI